MSNKIEYFFEKDIWGRWKLVPKQKGNGGWIFIVLFIVIAILLIAIITMPLWIALIGFTMIKSKRYYAGIGSMLTFIYFLTDVKNKWISGLFFLGYEDNEGKLTEGLFDEKYLTYIWIINIIGALIGLYFIIQYYSPKSIEEDIEIDI